MTNDTAVLYILTGWMVGIFIGMGIVTLFRTWRAPAPRRKTIDWGEVPEDVGT